MRRGRRRGCTTSRAWPTDRKSGVEGKRGDLGGRRIIKKKKKKNDQQREHYAELRGRARRSVASYAADSVPLSLDPQSISLVRVISFVFLFFFFQAEDGIRDYKVTGVQTCALPISYTLPGSAHGKPRGLDLL